jgi:uncharacterized protein YoxC
MPPLTDHAQQIIEDFKKKIEILPVNERVPAIQEMTLYLSALNEEAKEIVELLNSRKAPPPPPENTCEIEDLSDFK